MAGVDPRLRGTGGDDEEGSAPFTGPVSTKTNRRIIANTINIKSLSSYY